MLDRSHLAVLLVLSFVACGPEAPDTSPDGTWVGTITAEGDVTTVVNESGSVWGGAATLVEETSIGVENGPDEHMLGEIVSLYATDDEIYLLDQSALEVRVYDFDGEHLRSFARGGQGPGELGDFIRGMLVDDAGRLHVGDLSNRRITIYSREGEPVDEFPLPSRSAVGMAPMVLGDDGGIWLSIRIATDDDPVARMGFQVHTAEGPVGEPLLVPEIEFEELTLRVQGRDLGVVPFAPRMVSTFSYDRALIAGASDTYSFRIMRPSGEVTRVERSWDPVPVTSQEADYWRRFTIAQFRGREMTWNGDNIPDHKPAFLQFLPSTSGDIWALRLGGGGLGACDLEPEEAATSAFDLDVIDCLYPNHFFDVFDRDGRFLGSVEGLQLTNTLPFVAGDTVIAPVQDDSGTIMVKRYRLVLPGEG